jgi:hypothetical protein
MSIIAAGTTTTTALSSTGNTDGTLQFQVNGTTASVTLNTLGAIGVGASPSFGSSGQVLVSAGSTAAPAWAAVALPSGGTITSPVINDGYTEETAVANTSTAYTIDLANGSVQYLTLTGNCTYTFPTPVAGKSFMLIQKQDGTGGRTVTWPASVKWPGGTAPTLTSTASKADKFIFTAVDGSSWLGSNGGQNYTV